MDSERQIGKNFAWLSSAQIGIRILGAIFFFFLSYILKDEGLGRYSFVASLVPFWFILVDFGAGSYLYREWTHGKNDLRVMERDFSILFTVRLVIIALLFVPFVVTNYVSNRPILDSLILFFIALCVSQIIGLYDLYLQSVNRFNIVAIRQILEKVIATVVAALLLLLAPKVWIVFLSILLSYFGVLLYYRYWVRLPFRLRFIFDWRRTRELFRRGTPFALFGMFAAIYGRIDMIMLRYLTDFNVVGWYSAAYKFWDITFMFPSLFLASIFPLLSASFGQEGMGDRFSRLFEKSLRLLFSVGLFVGVFFVFFAPRIIDMFFADSFAPAALALRILMIGQTFVFLSLLFYNVLVVQRKESIGLYVVMACALINVVLNMLLIPKFSLYGAAWATMLAELVNLLLLQYYAQWKCSKKMLAIMIALVMGNVLLFALFHAAALLDVLWLGVPVLLLNGYILISSRLVTRDDLALLFDPFMAKIRAISQTQNKDSL